MSHHGRVGRAWVFGRRFGATVLGAVIAGVCLLHIEYGRFVKSDETKAAPPVPQRVAAAEAPRTRVAIPALPPAPVPAPQPPDWKPAAGAEVARVILPLGSIAKMPANDPGKHTVRVTVQGKTYNLVTTTGLRWRLVTAPDGKQHLLQELAEAKLPELFGFGVTMNNAYADGLAVNGEATDRFVYDLQPGQVEMIELSGA